MCRKKRGRGIGKNGTKRTNLNKKNVNGEKRKNKQEKEKIGKWKDQSEEKRTT